MTARMLALLLLVSPHAFAAEPVIHFVTSERLEYNEHADALVWDFKGHHGRDLHKFAWKSEGEFEDGSLEHGELQLLYRRAWRPYFDLQLGVRHERFDRADVDITSLAFGVEGMTPYGFEIDAMAFLSEDGDLFLRAEVERDILLSQKLVLQPRVEADIALSDVPAAGIDSGVEELEIDLRLRYEFTRKFAPYIGVSHETESEDTSLVAGLRFWF